MKDGTNGVLRWSESIRCNSHESAERRDYLNFKDERSPEDRNLDALETASLTWTVFYGLFIKKGEEVSPDFAEYLCDTAS